MNRLKVAALSLVVCLVLALYVHLDGTNLPA
jgi:hypothetical protein